MLSVTRRNGGAHRAKGTAMIQSVAASSFHALNRSVGAGALQWF
jgi:hypothetical protein